MKKRILSLIMACTLVVTGLAFPTTVSAADPTNVASGKTVYVSSDGGDQVNEGFWSYVTKNFLTDADNSTWSNRYVSEWCGSNVFKTQYIAIDLEAAYELSSVKVVTPYGGGLPKEFTILVYDGVKWVPVYEGSAPTDGSDTGATISFDFEPIVGNAVKFLAEELSKIDNSGVLRLTEMEAYGVPSDATLNAATFDRPDNIVSHATATTSHPWTDEMIGYGYGPAALIDGQQGYGTVFFGTPSTTDETLNMSATLTFDKTYRINEVALYPAADGDYYGGGFPVDFILEVKNGETWTTVKSVTGYPTPDVTNSASFHIPDVDCEAIRLTTTRNGAHWSGGASVDGKYIFRLGEISVYGTEVVTGEDTPSIPTEYTEVQGQGTPFASSSMEAVDYGVGLKFVNDHDMGYGGNYYASASFGNAESSEYVGLIFDEAYWFNSITVESYLDEYPTSFKISVYNGSEWMDVVTKDSAPTSAQERTFNFDPICGSAVKLTADMLQVDRNNKESGNYYLKVVEMRVQGAKAGYAMDTPSVARFNACEGMSVTAGSVVDWGKELGLGSNLNNLIDNYYPETDPTYTLYASTFVSTPDNYEWVQVTFDAPMKVNSVRFDVWSENGVLNGFPKDFKMQAYNGTEWVTLFEQNDYTRDSYRFGFAATECSAVRFIATELSALNETDYALVIKDMQVFAENTTSVMEKPVEVKKHYPQSTAAEVLSWGTNEFVLHDDIRDNAAMYYTSELVGSPDQEVQAQFLFEKSTYIERVRFYVPPNEKCPTNIKIFAFTGSEWQQIKEIRGYDRTPSTEGIAKHEFSFKPVYCSGVIIVASGLSELDGGYGFRMNEIALMGCQGIADGMVLGDVNEDGKLTENDLQRVREKLVGFESSISVDFDMTWEENARDLARAKRYFMKKNS